MFSLLSALTLSWAISTDVPLAAGNRTLELSLSSNRLGYILGEPIYLTFLIKNSSDERKRVCVGRRLVENIRISINNRQLQENKYLPPPMNGVELGPAVAISPHSEFAYTIALNEWLRPTQDSEEIRLLIIHERGTRLEAACKVEILPDPDDKSLQRKLLSLYNRIENEANKSEQYRLISGLVVAYRQFETTRKCVEGNWRLARHFGRYVEMWNSKRTESFRWTPEM